MRKVRVKKTYKAKPNKSGISKFEIAKLELRQGDILVLRTDLMLTEDQCTQLRDNAQKILGPGIKVLLLTAGFSLAVIQDKRAAWGATGTRV